MDRIAFLLQPDESKPHGHRRMKMLFPPNEGAKVKEVRKKLCAAGIPCRIKKIPLTEGLFGIPPYPELFIENERDILRALKVIGSQQLRGMTVVFRTQ